MFRPIIALICFVLLAGPAFAGGSAPTSVKSAHSVADTIAKLETALTERNMKLFTKIDHQAAAREAGLEMPAATVLIFGTPRAGTPLFLKAPTLAIDLPLKILVYEDKNGDVFVAYNPGEWMGEAIFSRHGLQMGEKPRAGMTKMLSTVTETATK